MRVTSTAAITFWQRRSESELCEPAEQRAAKETPSPDRGQGAEAEVGPDKSREALGDGKSTGVGVRRPELDLILTLNSPSDLLQVVNFSGSQLPKIRNWGSLKRRVPYR